MKRLKGAMYLHLKGDIIFIVLPLILSLIFTFFKFCTNDFDLKYTEYSRTSFFMAAFDYWFTLTVNYFAYSNFTFSRKLFFNSTALTVVIKSFLLSLMGLIYIVITRAFFNVKGKQYWIQFFSENHSEVSTLQYFKLFITTFSLILVVYFLAILIASIAKATFLLMVLSLGLLGGVTESIFNQISEAYCYSISGLLLGISIILYIIGWFVFKKRSDISKMKLFAEGKKIKVGSR